MATGLGMTIAGCAVAFALVGTTAAWAQKAQSEGGRVLEMIGPIGSTIVVRGAQSYALQTGDLLFFGDRIVTRSNGIVKLSVQGCERDLNPTSSIVINDNFCSVVPISVAGAEIGVGIGQGGWAGPSASGEVGATPGTLSLLAISASAVTFRSARVVD